MRALKLLVAVILAVSLVTVGQTQQVYKSIDENGLVTYSTSPPEDGSDAEIIVIDPVPQTTIAPVPPSKTQEEQDAAAIAGKSEKAEPQIREISYEDMSLEELDAQCDAAREVLIAPMRAAEIEHCVQGRSKRDFCERFFRDLGDAHVNPDGVFVPRMFNDIPQCVLASDEHRRRSGRNADSGKPPTTETKP